MKRIPNIVKMTLLVVLYTAVVEFAIMAVIEITGLENTVSPFALAVLDTLTLSILVVPFIYLFVVRPIQEHERNRSSELNKLRKAVETSGEVMFMTDLSGVFTYVNPEFTRLYGYVPEEVVGKVTPRILKSNKMDSNKYKALWNTVLAKQVSQAEIINVAKDGRIVTVEASANPILNDNGDIVGFFAIQKDISGERQSALKIRQLNRFYEMITRVNHIHRSLTFIHDKHKLFEETCRHIVESGLFRMAWIGVPDYKERLLKPEAYSGVEDGYLGEIRVSMDDIPEGRGPGGMAFREKRPFVCNDITLEHGGLLWYEEALRRGYRSMAAFPLMAKEHVFGILCLYSADADSFGDEEIKILNSLTEHIAFAVEAMERDQLRRQLGTSLTETEERLRAIINNSSTVIYVKDIKEKYIMVNRQYEALFHVNGSEMIGKSDHDMFPAEMADAFVANDRKVLSLRTPLEIEETVLVDGNLRTYISVKFPLFDTEGIPYAVCGISMDITERKKMESELRKSEVSLAEAQKMAVIGNWDWDMANDKVSLSDELVHILGFSSQEEIPHTYESSYGVFIKMLHPADAERIKMGLDNAISGKKPFKEEFRIVIPDGRVKIIYMQAVFVFDESGKPVRMSGTMQDITERRNAEESVQLLQAITIELNNAVSLGSAMEIILRKVSIATDWGYGEIWMPKAGGKWLEDNVAIYKAGNVSDDFNNKSKNTIFPIGTGIPGQVLQNGKPLWIKDVTKNPDFIRGKYAQEAGFKTAMAIPVFAGKEIVAVMLFFAFKERQEDEHLINMVTSVAAQLGQVIKRRISEEELRKSESSLAEAQRIAHIGNWDWDIVKNELLWSDEIYRIFGLEPRESISTFEAFLERVHHEDRDFVKGSVQSALKQESDYRIDHRIIMPDKTERVVYEQAKVFFNDGGVAVRMIGTVQDITERKRAEEELRLLQSVTLLVSDAPNLDDAYRITLRAVCSAIGWAYGEIWVPDAGNKFLLYSQTWHGSYKELEKFRSQSAGYSFPPGIGIPGAVFLSKQPRWVKDISRSEDFIRADIAKDVGLNTGMAIPVVADNGVIAVMVFCSFKIQDEDEHLMDLVASVSTQLGSVLQRKKTDKALKESEDRYRAIFETTGNATVIVDEKDRILLANREFVKLSGYAREEIENIMTFKQFVVEDDWKKIYDYHITRRIVAKGTPRHYEFRMANKKGEIRDIYMATSVIPETGKSVASLLDITEFKKMSESLRKSEERYRRFFEEDLAGDFILSSDGRVISCNPAFARIFGFESDKGAVDFDFLSLFADASAKDEFLGRLKIEKRLENCEVELKRTDGSEVFIIANVVGDFDSRGGLAGIKGYVFDNTERKKIEDQLRQSQKIEAIGRLAGGIAHDFNNLLTVISGYNSMLMNTVDRNDLRFGYVEQMQKAAERASALTRQLLAFSRKQILSPQVLDINAVIANIENMLRRIISENIELKTVLKSHIGRIKADPGQIEQVIMNLSVNARDAMPNGGVLTIGTDSVRIEEVLSQNSDAAPGDYIMLTVSDTGTGMSDEVKAHIFEPFFTTKEQGKGTGLGLSTVYGIVKQSGGYVVVYSESGIGTTFKIYLPGMPEETDQEESAVKKDEQKALKRGSESILLVEDDKGVYALISTVLQDNGYVVHGANNGEDALKFIQTHTGKPVQLLITDVVMPQMSGGELAKRINRLKPELKVLFMSGYTDDDIVHHGVLDEGLMFIQKPFTPASFLTKVREVLDKK